MSEQPITSSAQNQDHSQVTYRDCLGYPGYRVGDDGSVWSCRARGPVSGLTDKWRKLCPVLTGSGKKHWTVVLHNAKKKTPHSVARLVLVCFVGPCPDGMECCHFNDNRNDNRLNNLRWDTRKANRQDAIRNGKTPNGECHYKSTLTKEQILVIRAEYDAGNTLKEIAHKFNITSSLVYLIGKRINWKHV